MSKKRKIATSPLPKKEIRCIIYGKPSSNGKYMCRRGAEGSCWRRKGTGNIGKGLRRTQQLV